jgi:uncharacterized protein YbjT (DUF2867 family)
MKIVVTTPVGNVGSRVTRLLLQSGIRPTLFLRHPDRLDAETARLADVVQGDQLVADDVLSATEGADALFWVDPPGYDDPVAAYERAGANAARAVREHGIARTVFQSSVGAEKRHGAGEIDGLARTEELLDATGASVTHLRCGFFYTNLLLDPGALEEGVLRIVLPVDHPMPWVDPRDIGDVAAARLLSTAWSGRHVLAVHGPEHLTYARATELITSATGRPLRAERIADDDMRAGLRAAGFGDAQVEAVLGMSTGLREGFEPEDPRTILTTTPTTLAAWAYEHLR